MKKAALLIPIFSFLISFSSFSQTWQWAKSAGGSGGLDIGLSICTDTSGNSYVTGVLSGGPALFGACGSISGSYPQNIFIAKYDSNGLCIWIRSTGGAAWSTSATSIGRDDSNNVYITGLFTNTITFGTVTLSGNSGQVFVVKYDQDGNLIWAKASGGSGTALGSSIAVDHFGNSYISGYFQGATTFGTCSVFCPASVANAFVVKYNNAGQCLWAQKLADNNNSTASTIKCDSYNGVYVSGSFQDTLTVGSQTITSNGPEDNFIAKYDTSGICLWARSFGSSTLNDAVNDMGVDSTGNLYLIGHSTNLIYLNCDTINYQDYILKFDNSGSCLWAKQMDGGNRIYVERSGSFYATGTFTSTTNYDICTVTGSGIFVLKYDSNGNCLGVAQINGSNSASQGIVCDEFGSCFVTGQLFPGTTTFGSIPITVSTGDVFIAKLSGLSSVPSSTARTNFFNVYPNPSEGSYTMEVSDDFLNSDMFINDAMGNLIYQTKVVMENSQINIPSLSSGIYFVKLVTPNGTSVQRSIMQE